MHRPLCSDTYDTYDTYEVVFRLLPFSYSLFSSCRYLDLSSVRNKTVKDCAVESLDFLLMEWKNRVVRLCMDSIEHSIVKNSATPQKITSSG